MQNEQQKMLIDGIAMLIQNKTSSYIKHKYLIDGIAMLEEVEEDDARNC